MSNNKVILAFSGGLDTSFCAVYLARELQLEVHAVTVNTGGFNEEELDEIKEKAYGLGIKLFTVLDETHNYYQQFIKFLIFGNVLKNNTYPLSVSAERTTQAKAIAEFAKKQGAAYVAHGSTGAGNDQVRFDMIFQTLIPEVAVLTPIRDLKLSRNEEIAFLHAHGCPIDPGKADYSINKGLWGTSVGGKETLTSHTPLPEAAYPTALETEMPEHISISFYQGEINAVNDQSFANPVDAIQHLQQIAGRFAIGRDIHIGDTIIGIKGRVGFEAAAPLIILKAHHALEKHVLGKWQMFLKNQLSDWYGNLLHEGQYLDPVMRNIEKFLADSQTYVSGKVFITLAPYRYSVDGVSTPHDQMSARFGSYGEMNLAWTSEDVKGFTKISGMASSIFHQVNQLSPV